MQPLVSVIVPAYNAELTVLETLSSALNQTYGRLEVIVVDDGSTDGTYALAESVAAQDARVRVFQQKNKGVAAARNTGLAKTSGDYLALLDSDDLWHKRKIELQLERLRSAPESVGLVYNWHRRIDQAGGVFRPSPSPIVEGWVFYTHLEWNFISNGSTPLIKASAIEDLRYNEELEGCEDYLLQLEIALRHQFVCVPAYLTGYRRSAGSLSANVARMLRSHVDMYRILYDRADAAGRDIINGRIAELQVEMVRNQLRRFRLAQAASAARKAITASPSVAMRHAVAQIDQARKWMAAADASAKTIQTSAPNFSDLKETEADGDWFSRREAISLKRLRKLDKGRGSSGYSTVAR